MRTDTNTIVRNEQSVDPTRVDRDSATELSKADLTQYCGNWIWRAVECLIGLPEFNPSPKWIAKRLNISLVEAVDALESLERLNIIRRDLETGYSVVQRHRNIDSRSLNENDYLMNHNLISTQLQTKLLERKLKNAKIDNLFIATNESTFSKYLRKLELAKEELIRESTTKSVDNIYCYGFSGVRLFDVGESTKAAEK